MIVFEGIQSWLTYKWRSVQTLLICLMIKEPWLFCCEGNLHEHTYHVSERKSNWKCAGRNCWAVGASSSSGVWWYILQYSILLHTSNRRTFPTRIWRTVYSLYSCCSRTAVGKKWDNNKENREVPRELNNRNLWGHSKLYLMIREQIHNSSASIDRYTHNWFKWIACGCKRLSERQCFHY
jgi:hypothetical protein